MKDSSWQYFRPKNYPSLRCAVNTETGQVMTEDKVFYSKEEVEILKRAGGLSEGVHFVKKVFDGMVVGCEDLAEPERK